MRELGWEGGAKGENDALRRKGKGRKGEERREDKKEDRESIQWREG